MLTWQVEKKIEIKKKRKYNERKNINKYMK